MADLNCDVLVVGGGVTGVVAAAAAGRKGAQVILLEARTFLGGNATTGLCLHNFTTKNSEQVVFGMAQEMVDRLIAMGGAVGHIPYSGFVNAVTPVDGDRFRILSTEIVAEANVRTIFGANVVEVTANDGEVTELLVAMKGGLRRISAKTIIDASGDADIAAYAGAKFRIGERSTGKMQPVSMLVGFHNVDTRTIAKEIGVTEPAMATRPEYNEPFPVYFNGTFSKWNDIVVEKTNLNRDHIVFFNTTWPNRINVNTSAVFGVDGTDPVAMAKATVDLMKQVFTVAEFLKEHVPGFKDSSYSPAIFPGVRESRNIDGLYEISDEDVMEGRKFEDGIGQVCFPVDIHDPDTGQAHFHDIGDDGAFDIPYRAMVPKGLSNVIVAGRCISATHYAHGATRNMAPCMVMGEAAGVAAAIASRDGIAIPDVAVPELQRQLAVQGVHLGAGKPH
jgi:hypothetical protein